MVDAFVRADALQCGFCTPGQIVSATALVEASPSPAPEEIRHAMAGNLCRWDVPEDRGGDCFVARLTCAAAPALRALPPKPAHRQNAVWRTAPARGPPPSLSRETRVLVPDASAWLGGRCGKADQDREGGRGPLHGAVGRRRRGRPRAVARRPTRHRRPAGAAAGRASACPRRGALHLRSPVPGHAPRRRTPQPARESSRATNRKEHGGAGPRRPRRPHRRGAAHG